MADQINTISTPDSCTIRQYKAQKRQTTVCQKLTLNPLVLAIIPEAAITENKELKTQTKQAKWRPPPEGGQIKLIKKCHSFIVAVEKVKGSQRPCSHTRQCRPGLQRSHATLGPTMASMRHKQWVTTSIGPDRSPGLPVVLEDLSAASGMLRRCRRRHRTSPGLKASIVHNLLENESSTT